MSSNSIVFKVLALVCCVLLVISVFSVLLNKSVPYLDNVLEDAESFEGIDTHWVDVIYWSPKLNDNAVFQEFVDFVNDYVIPPVKFILFVATSVINAFGFIGKVLYLYFV